MKTRYLVAIALAVVVAFACCACGQSSSPGAASTQGVPADQLKTMGDAYAVESDFYMSSYDDKTYVYVFDNGTAPMRVIADMTPEVYTALEAVDYSKDDVNEQIAKAVSPLVLKKVEDLSAGIPAQSELDKLIGKTGQDLIDDGYVPSGSWTVSDDSTEFSMAKGLYEFDVAFNEILGEKAGSEIEDPTKVVKDLTVKSVTYSRIADSAGDPDYDPA